MLARDRQRRLVERAPDVETRASTSSMQRAAEVGRAEDHRAATEHAGGDRALQRGGIGGEGHARRLHRRGQAMLGDRDEAEIEKEALVIGRHAAGRRAGRKNR